MTFVLGWVENTLGKGENAGYQHFLLFPQCFQKPPSSGSLKLGLCGTEFTNMDQSSKIEEQGKLQQPAQKAITHEKVNLYLTKTNHYPEQLHPPWVSFENKLPN